MKHIIITGGNAGIGKATAIALAKNDVKIVIASRDLMKAKKAVKEIKSITNSNEIFCLQCDLANLSSVRNFVQTYKNQFGKLDILINNAGLVTDKLQFTQDGFELQIGVNHLGPFLLTTQLINLLEKSSEPRIINLSSKAHFNGSIRLDTFKGEIGSKKYKGMAAYSQSKLANVLFTKELARRYPSICSHCLHPGVVNTDIAAKNDNKTLWKVAWKLISPFMMTPRKGAKTSVYLATSSEALKTNGKYFDEQKEKQPATIADDELLAKNLWEYSEKLVD